MRQHRLALYCYRPPDGVPEGVEVRDASDILAESQMFFGRRGSVAMFSDWFRYELQRRSLGTWIDTDIYLLEPLDMRSPSLFGEERPGVINNAVLRLPPNSPILAGLLELFERRKTPDWLPWYWYGFHRAREIVSGHLDISKLPWGSAGPMALTALARRFGVSSQALASEVFNPVYWLEADWISNPAVALDDMITERTVAVHLWNQRIQSFKNAPAAPGSFLFRLQSEGRR